VGNYTSQAATQAIGVVALVGLAWWLITTKRSPVNFVLGSMCGIIAFMLLADSPQLLGVICVATLGVATYFSVRSWRKKQRARQAPFCSGCGHDSHRGASCSANGCNCRNR